MTKKSVKAGFRSHQKECEEYDPTEKKSDELCHSETSFWGLAMGKTCSKQKQLLMLLRTMINCFLSAKENDFSFDQVDETQFFFMVAIEQKSYLCPKSNLVIEKLN